MIQNAMTSLKPAVSSIFKNKVNTFLALIPVFLGILIYIFLGAWVYGTVMAEGKALIDQYSLKVRK